MIARHLPRTMLQLSNELEDVLAALRAELSRSDSVLHVLRPELAELDGLIHGTVDALDRVSCILHREFRKARERLPRVYLGQDD